MFYFIASKFISSHNSSRSKYVLIVGSICYIILHAYLFADKHGETVTKFRHYLYYLFAIDAALTGAYMWLFGSEDKSYEEDEEQDIDVVSRDTKIENEKENDKSVDKGNIVDIHRKLLELRAKQELKLKDDNTSDSKGSKNNNNESPFARKKIQYSEPVVPQPVKAEQSARSAQSSVSIPLYISEEDTDIPVVQSLG